MATKSIFRSFTLPNGDKTRTMREEVRDIALQAVRDKAALPGRSQNDPALAVKNLRHESSKSTSR